MAGIAKPWRPQWECEHCQKKWAATPSVEKGQRKQVSSKQDADASRVEQSKKAEAWRNVGAAPDLASVLGGIPDKVMKALPLRDQGKVGAFPAFLTGSDAGSDAAAAAPPPGLAAYRAAARPAQGGEARAQDRSSRHGAPRVFRPVPSSVDHAGRVGHTASPFQEYCGLGAFGQQDRRRTVRPCRSCDCAAVVRTRRTVQPYC